MLSPSWAIKFVYSSEQYPNLSRSLGLSENPTACAGPEDQVVEFYLGDSRIPILFLSLMGLRIKRGTLLYSMGYTAVGLWIFNHKGCRLTSPFYRPFSSCSGTGGHLWLGARTFMWERLSCNTGTCRSGFSGWYSSHEFLMSEKRPHQIPTSYKRIKPQPTCFVRQ